MTKNWKYQKLGDLCKTSSGGTPLKNRKEFYDGGTIPWLRSGEVNNRNIVDCEIKITEEGLKGSSAKLFPPRTVLIAMYGATAGQVGVLNFESSTNQAVCGIYPNDRFIPEFLYYKFLEGYNELVSQATGGAQPNISQAKIKNTLVPLLTLKKQEEIVIILDKAFAAIDQAKANIEKNFANARELFQSKLNAIFSQRGDGWEEKKWKDMLEIRSGRNQKEVVNPDGEYPILGSAGKTMGYADDYLCEEGTTIIGRKGTINNPMYIESKFWNVDTAFGLHALDGLEKKFLYFFCLSYDFTQRDKGSGRPSLVKKDLLTMTMPVPDKATQISTIKVCNELLQAVESIEEKYTYKLNKMEELKKSILNKAFTGELTT